MKRSTPLLLYRLISMGVGSVLAVIAATLPRGVPEEDRLETAPPSLAPTAMTQPSGATAPPPGRGLRVVASSAPTRMPLVTAAQKNPVPKDKEAAEDPVPADQPAEDRHRPVSRAAGPSARPVAVDFPVDLVAGLDPTPRLPGPDWTPPPPPGALPGVIIWPILIDDDDDRPVPPIVVIDEPDPIPLPPAATLFGGGAVLLGALRAQSRRNRTLGSR